MSAIQSKVDICNLTLSGLSNRNTVMNIDTPTSDKEIVFSLWYDICRQIVLKSMMPNFALDRVYVSKLPAVPTGYVDIYDNCYEKPSYALKVLGVGDIDQKDNYSYVVEGNYILTNDSFENDAMPIRIIRDIEDVSMMSTEFVLALAKEMEKRVAGVITQDPGKKKVATQEAIVENANATALNAQENKPVRRSVSRFRLARNFYQSMNTPKR